MSTESAVTKPPAPGGAEADHAAKTSPEANVKGAAGLNGKNIVEPFRKFIATESEDVWSNADSYIVLGRDRPGKPDASAMGYGPKGHHGAHMIDLVVGRHAGYRKDAPDGSLAVAEYDNDGNWIRHLGADPDFTHDAARIYISQKCDIDDYFELDSPPAVGRESRGFSGIGMIADDIRIVARHGVRLYTASKDNNSQGAKNAKKGLGTALIHGNNTSGNYQLQPMVLGSNLRQFLKDVISVVTSNNGLIAEIHTALVTLLTSYANHTHDAPMGPSIVAATAGIVGNIKVTAELANKIPASMTNYALMDANCLTAFGGKSILSDWHFLN